MRQCLVDGHDFAKPTLASGCYEFVLYDIQAFCLTSSPNFSAKSFSSLSRRFLIFCLAVEFAASNCLFAASSGNPIQVSSYSVPTDLLGSATAGDSVSLVVTDSAVPHGPHTITYPVVAGNTLTSVAAGLATNFNAVGDLSGAHLLASSSGSQLIITNSSGAAATYSYSVTAAKTEQLWFDVGGALSAAQIFADELNGDVTAFNAAANCNTTGSPIFNLQIAFSGKWICSTRTTVSLSGTVHVNDVVRITFTDPALSAGTHVDTPLTTTSLTTSATQIASAVHAALSTTHIDATASGSQVRFISTTGNQTTYALTRVSGTGTEGNDLCF